MPGPFLSAVGGALKTALPAIASTVGGLFENNASAKQAALNRRFQERMSSTAYQRATKDMEAAGLNPALAYQQGGASSPAGSSAPMTDAIGKGVSTALQAKQLRASIALVEAQTAKTRSEQASVDADVWLKGGGVMNAGEPSWRDEQIALREANIAGARQRRALMPGELQLQLLRKQLDEAELKGRNADLPGRQVRGAAWDKARNLFDWNSSNYSTARDALPDALDAASAWARAGITSSANAAQRLRNATRGASTITRRTARSFADWFSDADSNRRLSDFLRQARPTSTNYKSFHR